MTQEILDLTSVRVSVDSVDAHAHRSPLVRPFVTAARRTDSVDYVVVDVQVSADARSARGQGSAAETVKVTGESAQTIVEAVSGPIRSVLQGVHASLPELSSLIAKSLPGSTSAKAAVDVALHDAVARLLGMSVGELLTARPEWGHTQEKPFIRAHSDQAVGEPGGSRWAGQLQAEQTGLGAPDVAVPGSGATGPGTSGTAATGSGAPGLAAEGVGALLTPLAADMTVSLEDPTTMAKRAREARELGYRILKIKLGNNPDEDRKRLAAVLEAVPDVRLRLDANQGWSPREAIELMGVFVKDGLPVDLVEQPVAHDDIEGLALVRRESAIPVMADESLWSPHDAQRLLDAEAADYFNIKLAKTGGLGPALDIARLAHGAGVQCMVGAMMEPRISITAAGHLAAVHPAVTMIDLDSPAWFAHNVPSGGYTESDGLFTLTGGEGLGLDFLAKDTDPLP